MSLTHYPHINLCSEAYTPPSIIYHTRTQILQKHRLTRLQNTSLSSFFETSTIHCDAPEPKEEEVKEEETASEEAEEEEEEEPEDVSLLSCCWVLVSVWGWW